MPNVLTLRHMKDLTNRLFKIKKENGTPTGGTVLVSEPFMNTKETCFVHGVVAVIDYLAEEGATGVVLNNRTEYMLDELFDGIDSKVRIPVFCGGPTGQDRLFFIHTLGPDIVPGARSFAPGLYIGGDFDVISEYVNRGYDIEGCVRFFVGYCNWVSGQIERELSEGCWATVEKTLSPDTLLRGAADSFWHSRVKELGADYRSWSLLPRDVQCN